MGRILSQFKKFQYLRKVVKYSLSSVVNFYHPFSLHHLHCFFPLFHFLFLNSFFLPAPNPHFSVSLSSQFSCATDMAVFRATVYPPHRTAGSCPARGSIPVRRAGVPAWGWGTTLSRVQGHVGPAGTRTPRSRSAQGERYFKHNANTNVGIFHSEVNCVNFAII